MLIFFGILSIIFGGFLYANGDAMNNDLDVQMESIFNDGVANPGSTYQMVGITLFILGFVLFFVGFVIYSNKKQEEVSAEEQVAKTEERLSPLQEQPKKCKQCGTIIVPDSKFCMECGVPLDQQEESPAFCPHCGTSLPKESKYCISCGKSVLIDV